LISEKPTTGRSSAPFPSAPRVVFTGFQNPTPVSVTVAPSGCQSGVAAGHAAVNALRAATICARPRVFADRHCGFGMYAFM